MSNLFTQEYLPTKLVDALTKSIFSCKFYDYRTKNNFLKCVGIIYHKQITKYYGVNGYVPLGSDYWKKVYGGNYYTQVIQPLLEQDIIQCHNFNCSIITTEMDDGSLSFKNSGMVSIRYRINPDLTGSECEIIKYNTIKHNVVNAEESLHIGIQEFEVAIINDKNFHVGIMREAAIEYVNTNAERICYEYLKKDYADLLSNNQNIEYHEYKEYLGGKTFQSNYSTVLEAKRIAGEKGKELFYFHNKFYIADIDSFLTHRVEAMKYYYLREINKIGALPIIDKTSNITLRLYNNLVNFPSKILPYITINNRTIIQSDLRTSQLLLFANILNVYIKDGEDELLKLFQNPKTQKYLKRLFKVLKDHADILPKIGVDISESKSGEFSTSDVTKFIRDVFFKDFYSVVQKELELPDRGMAKQTMFKLLFKMDNKYDELLGKFAKRYPVVLSIIADFKEIDDKKKKKRIIKDKKIDMIQKKMDEKAKQEKDLVRNFSVFLQCAEAEIFIDNILKPLRIKKIPCFTRHDSICVASGYEKIAEKHVKDVFLKFGFRYNHKDENMFWLVADQNEMDDSGFSDFIDNENLEFDNDLIWYVADRDDMDNSDGSDFPKSDVLLSEEYWIVDSKADNNSINNEKTKI